jgi:hypothetical protein
VSADEKQICAAGIGSPRAHVRTRKAPSGGSASPRHPWLDEGLATWAEGAVNGAPPFPNATIPPEVANNIGEPVRFWDQFEPRRYFLGAYLQNVPSAPQPRPAIAGRLRPAPLRASKRLPHRPAP